MTTEYLRLVLDTVQVEQLLFKMGEQLSRAENPTTIVNSVRLGRLTALQKPVVVFVESWPGTYCN